MEYSVKHNKKEKRFELEIDDMICHIDYEIKGTEILFIHTYVPAPLEGRGFAGVLTRYALEFAHQNRFAIVPICSFVKAYMSKHPTE